MVNALWARVEQFLLPSTCILCGDAGVSCDAMALDLCAGCADALPANDSACALCAVPLPASVRDDSVCGQCLRKPPRFHAAFCAFRYAYPIDHLIRALKFHARLSYGRTLGIMLANALISGRNAEWPEAIVPVPLADTRFRERGFNQAIELGYVLERRLGIPLHADLIVRTRMTREQTGLDGKERRKNVRGAFAAVAPLVAEHVAILDDVVTTGSTVNEVARVLRRAGAKRVEVWAVARTGTN